jgi:hypothetical protein
LLDDLLAWMKETNALLPAEKNPAYQASAAPPAAAKGKRGKSKRGADK